MEIKLTEKQKKRCEKLMIDWYKSIPQNATHGEVIHAIVGLIGTLDTDDESQFDNVLEYISRAAKESHKLFNLFKNNKQEE